MKSFTLILCFFSLFAKAQLITNESILSELRTAIIETDTNSEKLLSPAGFNYFMQKKTISYLTGTSDLALAKFYGTYSADSDRLSIGFNIPASNPYTKRLSLIVNPFAEADIKNNFATLYKDKKWKNNIRGGVKFTYLIPFSTINFWAAGSDNNRQNDFKIVRTKKYNELAAKLNAETAAKTASVTLLNGDNVVSDNFDTPQYKMKKKLKDAFNEIAKAETDYLESEEAYTWLQTGWVSFWFATPLTPNSTYVTEGYSQPFEEKEFHLWETNLQFSYLVDSPKFGSIMGSMWGKYFQNNSANADLLTTADYVQFDNLPGTDPSNLAILETNKAFIGEFKEFKTTTLNLQVVYMLPFNEALLKPGLSFRFERNWGDYSPTNLRFGLPITIQGKSAAINVELQYRINDINNYTNKTDFKSPETFGISLGVPFALLYK
ncbi:MAG: hypothetical protein EOO51_00315 [Flavobacterium sp.]|nr:MAG: hypothetical protein EOO51_00315 [Flavobacterium sp.]